MEKKTAIRSGAIAVAGIALSIYGSSFLLHKRGPDTPAGAERVTVQDAQAVALETSTAQGFSARPSESSLETATERAAGCAASLQARASVDALIEIALDAPCQPGEPLVVSHADLAFSGHTDHAGRFSAFIPALEADARVDLFLGDRTFLEAALHVEDVARHSRVVLQWTGTAKFSLHGFTDGAGFGSDSHLHRLNPFDPGLEEAFLISLGSNTGPEPMLAQIYSIPVELAATSRAEVELTFDSKDCGRVISAYVLETGSDGSNIREAQFSMPDCPTEPGTLVLDIPLLAARHATLGQD